MKIRIIDLMDGEIDNVNDVDELIDYLEDFIERRKITEVVVIVK
jgi:hypothetical protein